MNGLRYIRTRCNLSLNELADHIGVSRQALSAWENGKKEIPEQRKEQLANFFGVDKLYFRDITEKEKLLIQNKAMFRYADGEKEYYRFKPTVDLKSTEKIGVCFLGEQETSIDELYATAVKEKQKALARVENIFDDVGIEPVSMMDQMMSFNRGSTVYNMISDLMEMRRGFKSYMKVPFFFELISVWKAMHLAYGLINEEQITYLDRTDYYCGEDGEWIIQLAEQLKEHWEKEREFHETHHQQVKMVRREEREKEKVTPKPERVLTVEEQIAEAEEEYLELIKKIAENEPGRKPLSVEFVG